MTKEKAIEKIEELIKGYKDGYYSIDEVLDNIIVMASECES